MLTALIAGSPLRPAVERYGRWESALESLRADWARRPVSGDDLPAYAAGLPEDQQAEGLLDVVALHLRLAWRSGPGPRLEDLIPAVGRFLPAGALSELIEDEFLARHLEPHGDAPSLLDYRCRFPGAVGSLAARHLAGGRLALLARLGRGTSGEVWEAFDHERRARVAVKRPRGGAPAGESLTGEAQTISRLDHPGIVALLDTRPGGEECLVLSLARGPTLGERAAELHRLAPARSAGDSRRRLGRLVESFAAACDALAHAHARGIVHRDVKPGHVAVDDEGRSVVLDWGLARIVEETPSPDGPVGTPESMAPEQADGHGDERSDVFGLGAVLFEVLFGRSPRLWPGRIRPHDWRALVRQGFVVWPSRRPSFVPVDLFDLCREALALPPSDRPSAGALALRTRQLLERSTGRGLGPTVRRAVARLFGPAPRAVARDALVRRELRRG